MEIKQKQLKELERLLKKYVKRDIDQTELASIAQQLVYLVRESVCTIEEIKYEVVPIETKVEILPAMLEFVEVPTQLIDIYEYEKKNEQESAAQDF